jgi:hypothetical protein
MAEGLSEEDVIKYNTLVMAGRVPQEESAEVSKLLGFMQTEAANAIRRKHLELNPDYFKEDEDTESKQEQPKAQKPTPKDDSAIKAGKAYRALQKTEALRLLKGEVLLAQDHTCLACERKISTRSEHEKITDSPYPLIVRCVFPPHKYIEAKGLFDPRAACTDQKLLNPDNYVAVCTNCKPMNFGGK